jgi:hypothetical protein
MFFCISILMSGYAFILTEQHQRLENFFYHFGKVRMFQFVNAFG